MSKRILALASSVVLAGAVGAGVSIADEPYGDGGHGHQSQPPQAPGNQNVTQGAAEGMVASRLAWSAYLTGQDEVDATGDDAGDPDGKGTATFFQVDEKTVC